MSDSSSDESSRSPSPVPSLVSRHHHSRPTQDRPTTENHQPASPQAPASSTKESTQAQAQPLLQPPPPQAQLQPQSQRKASKSRHRGRSHTRRSPSVADTISDAGAEEILTNGDKRRKRKTKKRQQQHPLPVVNEVVESTGKEVVESAGNAVQNVGDTAGAVTQAVKPSEGGGSDKPLKLRLDLNLDADIRLTAKIHGDITLSLLPLLRKYVWADNALTAIDILSCEDDDTVMR